MIHERLFRLAYEAIALTAIYRPGEGWQLTVVARRQDESFDEAHRATYAYLSTDELADVVCCEVSDRIRQG